MKNFIKYSFSILIMISCVVLFTIVSFKVLIVGSLSEDTSAEAPPAQEEPSGGNDESKEEGETAEPSNPEPEKPTLPRLRLRQRTALISTMLCLSEIREPLDSENTDRLRGQISLPLQV